MALNQRISLAELLSNPNFIYVCNYCRDNKLTPKEALDQIVREWKESKEIEPLKCKLKPSDLSILQNTLDNIDARLSWIEGQLEKQLGIPAKTK